MSANNILIKLAESTMSTASAANTSYIMPGVTSDMLQKHHISVAYRLSRQA
jgi:hypothetical protein